VRQIPVGVELIRAEYAAVFLQTVNLLDDLKGASVVGSHTGMGDSLYALLGVGRDADRETIQAAYRDRASDEHPDVSDEPNATRRFKRLTVARDVLVDPDERQRYDDLGHEAYLRTHSQAALFDLSSERPDQINSACSSTAETGPGSGETASNPTATDGTGSSTWWREGALSQETSGSTTAYVSDGPSAAWARASETVEAQRGPTLWDRLSRFFQEAGGWLVFHVLLLGAASATGWVIYLTTPSEFAVAGLFVLVGIISVATFAVVLHLISLVYT